MGYSLIRSRRSDLRIDAEFDHAALTDDSIAGRIDDKRVNSGTLTLFGDNRDTLGGGGFTSLSLSWTPGDLDLSRVPGAQATDAAGLGTEGSFHRIDASVARLQSLPAHFSFFARLTGQWASKNLDSSQEFSLGGPYALRAWPIGEGRGDMGFIGSAELLYDLPAPPEAGTLQFAAFLDTGGVKIDEDPNGIALANACGCNSYELSDAGIGVRWHFRFIDLDASYAHALGGNPGRGLIDGANADGGHDRHAFWLRASVGY
jgi:hemolysin activation/secretion protein